MAIDTKHGNALHPSTSLKTRSVGLRVQAWSRHDSEEKAFFIHLDAIDFSWGEGFRIFLG